MTQAGSTTTSGSSSTSTTTKVTKSLIGFSVDKIVVNESTQQATLTVTATPAPTADILFEAHPGKATPASSAEVAAGSKDYISKINGAYPSGKIVAGATTGTVIVLFQSNLLKHSADEVYLVHLKNLSSTIAKVDPLHKSVTVAIHQDQAAATFG